MKVNPADDIDVQMVNPHGNRSREHEELAHRALAWLSNKSGNGIRATTEFFVGEGYVADSFALCSLVTQYYDRLMGVPPLPTYRYLIDENAENKARWKREHDEHYRIRHELKVPNYFAFVFEVKVSRSDFLSTFSTKISRRDDMSPYDRSGRGEIAGNFHFVVVPRKMVEPKEVPLRWGILTASGRGLRMSRKPEFCPVSKSDVYQYATQLLWARSGWNCVGMVTCPDCCENYPTVEHINMVECPECGHKYME